jgi:hypothetical protein
MPHVARRAGEWTIHLEGQLGATCKGNVVTTTDERPSATRCEAHPPSPHTPRTLHARVETLRGGSNGA